MKNLHAILKKRKLEVFLSSIDMKDITNWKKVLDNGEIENAFIYARYLLYDKMGMNLNDDNHSDCKHANSTKSSEDHARKRKIGRGKNYRIGI